MEKIIEAYTGITSNGKKSRNPAKMDKLLTFSGVILAIFMMGHMFFVSTILISKDFMYKITKIFELDFIFEGGLPIIVSIFALIIGVIFVVHAILAVRKFPTSYSAYLKIKEHAKMMKHKDTSMWMFQFISGVIMMFAVLIHLYIIFTQPQNIGPFASADRIVGDNMWLLYVVLLICVEIHGTIGLYRAAMKWGFLDGPDPKATRIKLLKIKKMISAFFLVLGFVTLFAYVKIGLEHSDNAGEKYIPTSNIELVK